MTLLIARDVCPVCTEGVCIRLPADWQARVAAGDALDIVGCGNPWHYAIAGIESAQDIADGQALRELREAMPDGASTLRLHHWRDRSFSVFVDTMGESWTGKSPTIAEAADACRKALEASHG